MLAPAAGVFLIVLGAQLVGVGRDHIRSAV
jgi:hypothetical protein